MSFKEVKALRNDGKLVEALTMASQDLENNPSDIWNKRSISWVYYDYLKANATKDSYEKFIDYLSRINSLDLPSDEKMLFDTCAYQIAKIIYDIAKEENIDFQIVNSIFEQIQGFHFTKPSEAYSIIYKAFHKCYKDHSNYSLFADWWDFNSFRPEDYLSEDFKGKKMMSIAEQAYITYSKKLLEGETKEEGGWLMQNIINKEKIQAFLPKLNAIIEQHPEYQYPPYYKAKFLLLLGEDQNILSAFLPFARQKRNDFWVWGLITEIFPNDKDTQFACYCKALSLNTPEEFLVKTRQSFVKMLVEKQLFEEAKTEIQLIVKAREANNWPIPGIISNWIGSEWYKTANQKDNNKDLYLKNTHKAEEIIFQDIAEEIVLIDYINLDKKMISFVSASGKFGFFKYQQIPGKLFQGDALKVRFSHGTDGERYFIYTVSRYDEKVEIPDLTKAVTGTIRIGEGRDFGFVEDAFVSPLLIKNNNLSDKQTISGLAMKSFDKKKNNWSWKMYHIKQV